MSQACPPDRIRLRHGGRSLAVAALLLVLVANVLLSRAPSDTRHATVTIGGKAVQVDVATAPAEREQGLGGREHLAPDTGMLFIFPEDGMYRFWMKDMRFPIDMLWLTADGTIVGVHADVLPSTYPATFGADVPARYVLELPAGYAQAYGIRLGDVVSLGGI